MKTAEKINVLNGIIYGLPLDYDELTVICECISIYTKQLESEKANESNSVQHRLSQVQDT